MNSDLKFIGLVILGVIAAGYVSRALFKTAAATTTTAS
jgi:hypothetical protein